LSEQKQGKELLTLSQDLIINPDYSKLIRPLSAQGYTSLKRSIQENGQHIAIVVNSHNVVLDGYHRYKICTELGIKPKIVVKDFASPDHEKLFVYECNVRRDLTRYERIVLEIAIQNTKDRINQAQQNSLANLKRSVKVPKLEHRELQGRLVERVAKNTKYGHSTVSKVKKLLDTAPEISYES
jgi:ParB-like chromosome segregation protein Spo0J